MTFHKIFKNCCTHHSRLFMKYLLVCILFFLPLHAENYPSFTQNELKSISKKNPISAHRIQDYTHCMQSCKQYPPHIKLNRVNFYLNRLLSQYDDITNKQADHWATPKEFLTGGYGDCEDYAIIKYYSLIKLGFDEKRLFLSIVTENFYGGGHMVLAYFQTDKAPPLILDNLSFKILDLQKRSDLTPQYFINSTGIYTITPQFTLHKVASSYPKFEALRQKVQKNH